MSWACCLCTVGQVVHTLPEGELVLGVTLLAGELYVLRRKERDQVEVYDVISYRLQRCLNAPGAFAVVNLTSCGHYRCVYIADFTDRRIHSVPVDGQGATTQWDVDAYPASISVNAAHNVLVTCPMISKVKEFSSHGDLLRELTLPDDVVFPCHAIQISNGEYIVSHGDRNHAVHRVCKLSADGKNVIQSHGGQRGSDIGQCDSPVQLAVDNNEFVFVLEAINRRVTLLSPTLDYVSHFMTADDPKWRPDRLCLDTQRRRLYVAQNEYNEAYRAGRIVVFTV